MSPFLTWRAATILNFQKYSLLLSIDGFIYVFFKSSSRNASTLPRRVPKLTVLSFDLDATSLPFGENATTSMETTMAFERLQRRCCAASILQQFLAPLRAIIGYYDGIRIW
jgi:hypothetical protein